MVARRERAALFCARVALDAPARGRSSSLLERITHTALTVAPLISAAVLPAAVVTIYFSVTGAGSSVTTMALVASLGIASLHVLLLGIPGVLFLRRIDCVRWWSLLLLGFVAGCIPFAIYAGVPSAADWVKHARAVLVFGACGAIGALGYWLTTLVMRSNNRWRGP